MAFAYVAERGTAGSLTGTIQPTGTIAVGRMVIMLFAWTGGTTATAPTDTQGNTWQIDVQKANGSSASVAIASCRVTTQLTTGSTITINGADMAGSGHGIMLEEFSGVKTSGAFLDVTASNSGPTSTSATTGTTAATAQNDELAIEVSAPQATGYTFTKDAAYSYFTTHESNRTGGAYQILTTTGTQGGSCSWVGTAVNWAGAVAVYLADAGSTYTKTGAGVVPRAASGSESYSPTHAFRDAVMRYGPIVYYEVQEGSGATVAWDTSANARHGTYSGSPSLGNTSPEPFLGQRFMALDGVNDELTFPSGVALPLNSPVTVMFWQRMPTANVNASVAFSVGGLATPDRCSAHFPFSDVNAYWDYGDTGAGRISTSYTPWLDLWKLFHLVSAGNGGNFKGVYVNGVVAVSSGSSDGPNQAVSGGALGGVFLGSPRPKGQVTHFAVYDQVLSPSAIAEQYAASQPMPPGQIRTLSAGVRW